MTTTTLDVHEIARRFAAVSNEGVDDPNFEDLFAEQVSVWHNYDAQPVSLPGIALATALRQEVAIMSAAMADLRQEQVRLLVCDDTFVLTRTTKGTLPDGSTLALSQCLINVVEEGRIVRAEAYLDREQAAPIYAHLAKMVEAGEFTPPSAA